VEKSWNEMVYNNEEWKKFLRTARNRYILCIAMEGMNKRNQYQCDNVQNCFQCLAPKIYFSQQLVCDLIVENFLKISQTSCKLMEAI
jgi:hypothetical protein